MKPPTFACFPLILCLFIIIVQCLFHLWKPRSTTSVIWSASTFLIQQTFFLFKPLSNAFLSTLNFLEAEEKFLPLSKVHCFTGNFNSRVYNFLSVIFILNKRHATPRKRSKSKTLEMRILSLTWWYYIPLVLWVENMALCWVKLAKISSTIKGYHFYFKFLKFWGNLETCHRAM